MTSPAWAALRAYFYPRPPRGGRLMGVLNFGGFMLFLSTPSARRATADRAGMKARQKISIHALREEGDGRVAAHRRRIAISIHALREEGDVLHYDQRRDHFISIHALREEGDTISSISRTTMHISIHALREEGDRRDRRNHRVQHNFYPRPPRGGRPGKHYVLRQHF